MVILSEVFLIFKHLTIVSFHFLNNSSLRIIFGQDKDSYILNLKSLFPFVRIAMSELGSIIELYFSSGYQYNEIFTLLELKHKSTLSLRTLHRFLRKKNLFRKRNQTTLNEGIVFIGEELKGSGSCIGYRAMHQRCVKAGLRINRSTCAVIMKAIDPEGVAARKRRSLKRRLYYSKGTNWVWHLDGYDKLKP